MDLKLRKFAKFVDKTFIEGKKKAKELKIIYDDLNKEWKK